jgi:hypothetical protein
MTALQKFYFETPPGGTPGTTIIDPDGKLVVIPAPYPKRTPPLRIHAPGEPWKKIVERRMIFHPIKVGWYYKYGDWTSEGMGDVYNDDGLWTVVGPSKYVDRTMYTTWYRYKDGMRGEVVREYGLIPRGERKGRIENFAEVEQLFTHLAAHRYS